MQLYKAGTNIVEDFYREKMPTDILPRYFENKDFSSTLGMWEQEVAAKAIINSMFPDNKWRTVSIVNFKDNNDVLEGFACLIGNGWLHCAYPNGQFYLTNGLIERLKERCRTTN